MRKNILAALEEDLNITGIKKVWKYLPDITQIPESSLPSIHIQFGTEKRIGVLESTPREFEVPVIVIVFFSANTDVNNQGLLREIAEDLLNNFKSITNYPALTALNEVVAFEYESATPYINIGLENRGFLVIEFKLTYIGE